MVLMLVLGIVLAVGVGLTLWWGAMPYLPWYPRRALPEQRDVDAVPSLADAARRYLRGVAVALVAGAWVGLLVTGPAMRLIMRLLAVTAGDNAQGALTEAEEVVGNIDFGGTLGLLIFGGLLPGLLSGFIYVVVRRWLPSGRWGGVVFGLLHLVVAATRVDPLRANNEDFAIVGPGWLSVLTFSVAAVLHGMAVAAVANRYSQAFPARGEAVSQRARLLSLLPLLLPVLILIPGAFLLIPIGIGLVFSLGVLRIPDAGKFARDPGVLRLGRLAGVLLAAVCLPGTVIDLTSIVNEPRATTFERAPGHD